MAIKLLEISNGKVIPTEHCEQLVFLRKVKEEFPEEYLEIYAYLFYMSCWSEENPYFNRPPDDRESEVLKDLDARFDIEHPVILHALERTKKLYETPTVRAYYGISSMLEKLGVFMSTQEITDGRDGNITAMINAAKNFDQIRKSFKGVAKDLAEEQSSRARGGTDLGYDG